MSTVEEMTEIEIYENLVNLGKIQKQERARRLSENTLSSSAGMGDKKSVKKVNTIIKEVEQEEKEEERREKIMHGTPKTDFDEMISDDKLKEIMRGLDGGFKAITNRPKPQR